MLQNFIKIAERMANFYENDQFYDVQQDLKILIFLYQEQEKKFPSKIIFVATLRFTVVIYIFMSPEFSARPKLKIFE